MPQGAGSWLPFGPSDTPVDNAADLPWNVASGLVQCNLNESGSVLTEYLSTSTSGGTVAFDANEHSGAQSLRIVRTSNAVLGARTFTLPGVSNTGDYGTAFSWTFWLYANTLPSSATHVEIAHMTFNLKDNLQVRLNSAGEVRLGQQNNTQTNVDSMSPAAPTLITAGAWFQVTVTIDFSGETNMHTTLAVNQDTPVAWDYSNRYGFADILTGISYGTMDSSPAVASTYDLCFDDSYLWRTAPSNTLLLLKLANEVPSLTNKEYDNTVTTGGTVALSTAQAHSGTQSVRVNRTSNAACYAETCQFTLPNLGPGGLQHAELCGSFWVYVASRPSGVGDTIITTIYHPVNDNVDITMSNTGAVKIRRQNGTLAGGANQSSASATSVPLTTWTQIFWTMDGNTGTLTATVAVGSDTPQSVSWAQAAEVPPWIDYGSRQMTDASNYDIYFDDQDVYEGLIYPATASGAFPGFPSSTSAGTSTASQGGLKIQLPSRTTVGGSNLTSTPSLRVRFPSDTEGGTSTATATALRIRLPNRTSAGTSTATASAFLIRLPARTSAGTGALSGNNVKIRLPNRSSAGTSNSTATVLMSILPVESSAGTATATATALRIRLPSRTSAGTGASSTAVAFRIRLPNRTSVGTGGGTASLSIRLPARTSAGTASGTTATGLRIRLPNRTSAGTATATATALRIGLPSRTSAGVGAVSANNIRIRLPSRTSAGVGGGTLAITLRLPPVTSAGSTGTAANIQLVRDHGTNGLASASTTLTIPTTAAVAAGDYLVLTGTSSSGTATVQSIAVTTGTDPGNLSWTTYDQVGNATGAFIAFTRCPTGVNNAVTFTVTWSGVAFGTRRLGLTEWSGLAGASAEDTHQGAVSSSSATDPTVNLTTANANDLVIAGVSIQTATTLTPNGTFIEIHDDSGGSRTHGTIYQIESATGTFAPGADAALNNHWAISAIALKAAGTGSGVVALPLRIRLPAVISAGTSNADETALQLSGGPSGLLSVTSSGSSTATAAGLRIRLPTRSSAGTASPSASGLRIRLPNRTSSGTATATANNIKIRLPNRTSAGVGSISANNVKIRLPSRTSAGVGTADETAPKIRLPNRTAAGVGSLAGNNVKIRLPSRTSAGVATTSSTNLSGAISNLQSVTSAGTSTATAQAFRIRLPSVAAAGFGNQKPIIEAQFESGVDSFVFSGSNGSTGTVTQSTTQAFFGTNSLKLDGNSPAVATLVAARRTTGSVFLPFTKYRVSGRVFIESIGAGYTSGQLNCIEGGTGGSQASHSFVINRGIVGSWQQVTGTFFTSSNPNALGPYVETCRFSNLTGVAATVVAYSDDFHLDQLEAVQPLQIRLPSRSSGGTSSATATGLRVLLPSQTSAGSASTTKTYTQAVAADKPIDWWHLDESSGATATDSTGTNNGTYSGTIVYAQSSVVPFGGGTSVDLGSAAGKVNIADVNDFVGNVPYSVELWTQFKQPILTGTFDAAFRWIVGKQVPAVGRSGWGLGYYFGQTTNSSGPNSGRFFFERWNSDASNGLVWPASPPIQINPDRQYHVVATYDGATLRLYVNGLFINSSSAGLALPDTAAQIALGAFNSTFASAYRGKMDEVAIYDYALNLNQVKAHFSAGNGYCLQIKAPNVGVAGTSSASANNVKIKLPSVTSVGQATTAGTPLASGLVAQSHGNSTATATAFKIRLPSRTSSGTSTATTTGALRDRLPAMVSAGQSALTSVQFRIKLPPVNLGTGPDVPMDPDTPQPPSPAYGNATATGLQIQLPSRAVAGISTSTAGYLRAGLNSLANGTSSGTAGFFQIKLPPQTSTGIGTTDVRGFILVEIPPHEVVILGSGHAAVIVDDDLDTVTVGPNGGIIVDDEDETEVVGGLTRSVNVGM